MANNHWTHNCVSLTLWSTVLVSMQINALLHEESKVKTISGNGTNANCTSRNQSQPRPKRSTPLSDIGLSQSNEDISIVSQPLLTHFAFRKVKGRKVFNTDTEEDADYDDDSIQPSITDIDPITPEDLEEFETMETVRFRPHSKLYIQKETGYLRMSINPKSYLKLTT